MASIPTIEGTIPFDAPNAGKPAETWYKVCQPSPTLFCSPRVSLACTSNHADTKGLLSFRSWATLTSRRPR